MNPELEIRIRRAVDEGREVRSSYFAAIDLPDEQQLGAPAPEAILMKLESRLGKHLPDSYRAFLRLHNGWRMVDGSTDLLSANEILEGPIAASIEEWQEKALRSGDLIAAKSLVIGVSRYTPTRLLLDPESVDENGEWRVVQHHKDEEYEYPSFLAWLEESVEEFRELIRQETEENEQ